MPAVVRADRESSARVGTGMRRDAERPLLALGSAQARVVIARAQTGDRRALDDILRALQEPLFEHVRGITGDPDVARDALQESLLSIARHLASLRDPHWLRAWAYRIATREAVRHARLERRWREELDGDALDAVPAPEPNEPRFEPELIARLPELLETLPPASRSVLRLHYLEAMSFAEIAEALEIAVGTAKSRLAYALGLMRARIPIGRAP